MRRPTLFLIAAATLALTPLAQAGPPLLCFPYQIGNAPSLPWGQDAFQKKSGYDTSAVVTDTLRLLKTERSTLVRMETLRRAAVYIGDDARKASDLLARLSWIAMDGEAAGNPTGEAWFDAGYFAATIRQSGADIKWRPGVLSETDGYAWVKRAVDLAKDDAAMQFGAALVIHGHDKAAFTGHLRQAVAGASPGSDLARSIESNHACGAKPLQELRKELGDARADAGQSK